MRLGRSLHSNGKLLEERTCILKIALSFGSKGNYGKVYLEFFVEDEEVYKLRFQIKFRDDSVSKLRPRAFNWCGGFGAQNEFLDYWLGTGLIFFYNSSYARNQLQ